MVGKKSGRQTAAAPARDVLGYLNFSSGASEPRFLENLNRLFGKVAGARSTGGGKRDSPIFANAKIGTGPEKTAWRVLGDLLRAELQGAHATSEAFRHTEQAEAVLQLVFEQVLPAYREFHADLLFHQTEETLFQPFFIGRVCEAVLRQGGPWNQVERIVPAAIHELNDYIGHRPVAVLRTEQKLQPYDHEWVRPIPLWIRGAGAAVGPYRELIETALAVLDAADPDLRFDAMFNLEQLDELAVDPRAYDFDHPVNKRPNYLFGQWDMNKLDNAGLCRRFVLQQAALDAMLDRIEHHGRLARKQVVFEEAAVLAGTMLMGSGISGNRPDAHDSTATLATLVQKIAVYRDAFYERLLRNLKGPHAERLRAEAQALQQPLGGARQHFNHALARRRALQLQHVHLAQLFAAIGCEPSAARELAVVPVASARMACAMRCRMAAAHLAVDRGNCAAAAAELPAIEDLLRRAIQCGAMVDPWNLLGFGGQYSLFPAIENSIYDYRVDELLDTMSDIFMLYVRICKTAAAGGEVGLEQVLLRSLAELTRWWDQFASIEVGSIEGISGQETLDSATSAAAALRAWHEAGAAAGDLAFWRRHAEHFRTPKAYALVIDTLLDRRDPVAAMALLVQWLSQAEEIPLVEEDYSFHDLALSWMEDLAWPGPDATVGQEQAQPAPWPLARKFLDYLEANAEEYWQVPRFEMAAEALGDDGQPPPLDDELDAVGDEFEDDSDDEDELFDAAYEGVTYRDSADDGVDGEMFETGQSPSDFELVGEAERIVSRLNFLTTVAQLWKIGAASSKPGDAADRDEVLAGWLVQAGRNRRQLLDLLDCVHRHRIPAPHGTQESLVEYDHRRSVKETLLEEIIQAAVETADAARMIRASLAHPSPADDQEAWEQPVDQVMAALVRGDAAGVRRAWPATLDALAGQPLLYVALGRGGSPRRLVAARGLQCVLRRLAGCLPRLGLLTETCRLLQTAQLMEVRHPVGPVGVTEFDRVFAIACQAITQCLAVSSARWRSTGRKGKKGDSAARASRSSNRADAELIERLEEVVEVLLRCWLAHSRGARLSALEAVGDPQRWQRLKRFIKRYGADLFTQQFMNLGNLRGILRQGVREYLETLRQEPQPGEPIRLVAEIDAAVPLDEAAHWLETVLEAVVENYGEYFDYNSITTQSDRGEMLYTLMDFLRLRAGYDRLAWNLRPVAIAHETLVRCGCDRAANIWRLAVAERTAPMADEHQRRFERLCETYGMRLPSIAGRLAERFVRPLEIDRLCALVRPAIEQLREGQPPVSVGQLEEQIARFTREPPGAGFELPGWLEALEQEVDRSSWQGPDEEAEQETSDPDVHIPQVRLPRAEVDRQLQQMFEAGASWPFGPE
jgi:hypothetical protein